MTTESTREGTGERKPCGCVEFRDQTALCPEHAGVDGGRCNRRWMGATCCRIGTNHFGDCLGGWDRHGKPMARMVAFPGPRSKRTTFPTVLVCGGRDFLESDSPAIAGALDWLHAQQPIQRIVHGAARGADTFAGQWAREYGVTECAVPADWKRLGKGAGPARNRRMLEEYRPDLVVAFPGGAGTANMVKQATDAGVRVWRPMQPESARNAAATPPTPRSTR